MNRRNFLVSSSVVLGAAASAGFLWPRRWRYIVVHHSAGSYGNIDFLQKVHRERQPDDPVDAIPYHYVIGNGNGLRLGEVASDWRSRHHLWGAHVSGNNLLRNLLGIGICLIGNFEKTEVPATQYDALVALTTSLMRKFQIPVGNVSGHGYLEGEHTKCPGKNFPMAAFLRDIAVQA